MAIVISKTINCRLDEDLRLALQRMADEIGPSLPGDDRRKASRVLRMALSQGAYNAMSAVQRDRAAYLRAIREGFMEGLGLAKSKIMGAVHRAFEDLDLLDTKPGTVPTPAANSAAIAASGEES